MKLILILLLISLPATVYSQGWLQTSGTPEGAGVTDLVVRESNQHIFVTTASFNWPNGDNGGVRRSTNDGDTWENLNDVYIARTIIDAPDGNLYASIWPYPQDEGLYRSTDNGDNWGTPLVTVPTGDNIFSIALNTTTNPNTIFAGTRNGPLRSTDNGMNWIPAINGIPSNSWVRDIEVDSSGIVAAATTNGLFISTDNGNVWQQATGITDTIVKLLFDYPLTNDNFGNNTRLLAGSDNGTLVEAFKSTTYLIPVLVFIFDEECTSITFTDLKNEKRHGVATFPRNNVGGGYYSSTDDGQTWNKENTGLPDNPKTSALAGSVIETGQATQVNEYVGLFENANGGARIFKQATVVSVLQDDDLVPQEYALNQNYPNPFNPGTKISWQSPVGSWQTLKVYDLLGNEVAVLVDEYRPAGRYKVEFDAAHLSSGIYFYQLSAGTYLETKKMTILK